MEAIDKIEEMVKAGFPCYYIYTEDEVSVTKQLEKLSKKLSEEIIISKWTVNEGDLEDYLTSINKYSIPTFCILTNIHFFLEQPGIIQTIKDGIPIWKTKGQYVFFLENDKKIPPEINRNVTYLEFELPNKAELAEQVRFIESSVKENGIDLQLDNGDIDTLASAALGLTTQQAQDAFSLSIIRSRELSPSVVTEVKAAEYLKSGLLELESPVPIEFLQGYDNLKEWIYDIKDGFFGESKFGLPAPKGVLLLGPPGVGKTVASRAFASIFNLMLLKCDLGKVFGMYVGDSERNFRTLINIAEAMSPIVMRIDEIEKQLSGSAGNLDGGVSTKVLGGLLTWMQESTSPVFRIATANRVESLPPELLRKGRFDEIFFLDLPNSLERQEIFEYHIAKRSDYTQVNINLTEMTQGWSGAEIEQIIIQSLRKVERYEASNAGFIEVIEQEISLTQPLSVIRRDDIDKIRQWAVDNGARMASENIELQKQQDANRNGRRLMV
jgi:SpoVK/Ycf46/Vps4 family AAA+-type ATPase